MMNKIRLECNRLVYNPEFEKIEAEWDAMGVAVPEDLKVDKYNKLYLSVDIDQIVMIYQDDENTDWSVIMVDDMVYLTDVHYSVIVKKLKEAEITIISKKSGEDE